MSRVKPVDVISKREVLWGDETPREALIAYGDHFVESEFVHDALSFYMRADHEPGIRKIMDIAVAEGEVFILQRIERSHRIEIPVDTWRRAAESAERTGKLRYALVGFERAGDEERSSSIRAKLGIAEPVRPLPGTEIIDPAASR